MTPKEHPILFSGEMVRAILGGQKTQTRRIIKPQPLKFPAEITSANWIDDGFNQPGFYATVYGEQYKPDNAIGFWRNDCPYGKPGDWLWVRETWAVDKAWNHLSPSQLPQKAYQAITYLGTEESIVNPLLDYTIGKTRQSIFMPRSASRITLEITNVRAERLQDIKPADAIAEGLIKLPSSGRYVVTGLASHSPVEVFARLWDSINAARGHGWDTNPWVWVIEFKVAEVRK